MLNSPTALFMAAILNFCVTNMINVEINIRNGILMPELVRNELLVVKIAPKMKNSCSPETDSRFF